MFFIYSSDDISNTFPIVIIIIIILYISYNGYSYNYD